MSCDRDAPRVSRAGLLAMTPAVILETLPMVPCRLELLWRLELPVRPPPDRRP